jgi:hypothetical protein
MGDAGNEVTRAAAIQCRQRRRFPFALLVSGGRRRQARSTGKGVRPCGLETLPWGDHAHRSGRLRPFDPHEFPLAGEVDRPGEDAFAQRPRRSRAAFPRLGRIQRRGRGEGDVDQTESPEAHFQPLFSGFAGHFVGDELTLSPEFEGHDSVFGVFEMRVQAVVRLQREFDQDDGSLFRARARCGRCRSRRQCDRDRDRHDQERDTRHGDRICGSATMGIREKSG